MKVFLVLVMMLGTDLEGSAKRKKSVPQSLHDRAAQRDGEAAVDDAPRSATPPQLQPGKLKYRRLSQSPVRTESREQPVANDAASKGAAGSVAEGQIPVLTRQNATTIFAVRELDRDEYRVVERALRRNFETGKVLYEVIGIRSGGIYMLDERPMDSTAQKALEARAAALMGSSLLSAGDDE